MSVTPELQTELSRIITNRALKPLFQPIFHLNNAEIYGYEALIRGPVDSPLFLPAQLFNVALQSNMLDALEMLCRELSIFEFAASGCEGLLFLNVNPRLLLTADHPRGLTKLLLQKVNLQPSRVVIEISEQYQIEEPELLIKAVHHYRQLGFLIAIDDLGCGFSGLKLWSEIKPDIVKIDRYFISGIHSDPTKRAFVQNIIALSKATGARVIAEGIETNDELDSCIASAAEFGQGYLLGRPALLDLSAKAIYPAQLVNREPVLHWQECVGSIQMNVLAVNSYTPAGEVLDLFREHSNWHSLAVLEYDRPVGLINKAELQELFSTPYGRALYQKKPIIQLLRCNAVIVDAMASFDQVSQLVVEHEENENSWFFIITKEGRYAGLGSVRALLKYITERKLQYARYANPLTLLPGNVPIYQEVDRLLKQKIPFAVAYFDLNHFKPYNDTYGYSRGDQVLQLLAEIISRNISKDHGFIGHVGGDDFVVISTQDKAAWHMQCENIIAQFNERIPAFYDKTDVAAGGINAVGRDGASSFFPLLSIAIGITLPDPVLCLCHHDVAAITAMAKHEAKKAGGNAIYISGQRGPSVSGVTALARPLTG